MSWNKLKYQVKGVAGPPKATKASFCLTHPTSAMAAIKATNCNTRMPAIAADKRQERYKENKIGI